MSLPTPYDLKTMDYAFQGQPFVNVPAKTGMNLDSMDYAFQAQPFVANDGVNLQINISDVFKGVDSMKINIGDVWKDVVRVQLNVGDAWETIF